MKVVSNVVEMPTENIEFDENGFGRTERGTMTTDEFLRFKSIWCQRKTFYRLKKVAKFLKESPLPCHNEVALVTFLEKGEEVTVVINANTRGDIWALSRGVPTLSGVEDTREILDATLKTLKEVAVPTKVSYTKYHVKGREQAEKLYSSYDSQDAVENSKDKLTGWCRSGGIDFKKLNKLKKGQFAKSLQYAVCNHPEESSSTLENLLLFKEELLLLDKLSSTQDKTAYNANTICAFLMMLKKYGADKKVCTIIQRIEDNAQLGSSKKTGADGVTYLLKEIYQREKFDKWYTDAYSFPKQQDFILYCLEKSYKGETIKQYRVNGRNNYYDTFWNDIEE